jgi:hypothetical protein
MIHQNPKKHQENYREFAENFAKIIISQDFVVAHQYLAYWLQKDISPSALKESFENQLQEMYEVWEIEELIYPTDFSISSNSCSLNDLKKLESWRTPRKFSVELTEENFRQWMVIEFLPDEDDERIEFDAWFDFWFAAAEVNNELKIGYFEFENPD